MQIIALRTLRHFRERHPQAEGPLRVWYSRVKAAAWRGPDDVKAEFGSTVDFVADNRIVFDIGGNKFRLVVRVSYGFGRVLVKFVGTHRDYDRVDVIPAEALIRPYPLRRRDDSAGAAPPM